MRIKNQMNFISIMIEKSKEFIKQDRKELLKIYNEDPEKLKKKLQDDIKTSEKE